MPKTRPPYPPQLRARLVELARTGRTPRGTRPAVRALRADDPDWVRQADRDDEASTAVFVRELSVNFRRPAATGNNQAPRNRQLPMGPVGGSWRPSHPTLPS
jgi:hypothetical protein